MAAIAFKLSMAPGPRVGAVRRLGDTCRWCADARGTPRAALTSRPSPRSTATIVLFSTEPRLIDHLPPSARRPSRASPSHLAQSLPSPYCTAWWWPCAAPAPGLRRRPTACAGWRPAPDAPRGTALGHSTSICADRAIVTPSLAAFDRVMTQLRATSGPWLGLGSAQSVPARRYIRPHPPFM